jgi:hypothetical protein
VNAGVALLIVSAAVPLLALKFVDPLYAAVIV